MRQFSVHKCVTAMNAVKPKSMTKYGLWKRMNANGTPISNQSVYRWFDKSGTKRTVPDQDKLPAIARALGVTVEAITVKGE